MSRAGVVLELTRLEAAHLADLVGQFAELVDEAASGDDPAIDRLVPAAYADADAAREFRDLTERELLGRRGDDAALVLASLQDAAELPDDAEEAFLLETVELRLDADVVQAWLRTLAAVRLVLATRLGIIETDDHDHADPRFAIFDWLGYRLDGLVTALDRDD
ncbi:MAG: DUF2017 family protein [Microbacterium sp.]